MHRKQKLQGFCPNFFFLGSIILKKLQICDQKLQTIGKEGKKIDLKSLFGVSIWPADLNLNIIELQKHTIDEEFCSISLSLSLNGSRGGWPPPAGLRRRPNGGVRELNGGSCRMELPLHRPIRCSPPSHKPSASSHTRPQ